MPLPTSLVVKKGSKILSMISGGIPVPLSATSTITMSSAGNSGRPSAAISFASTLRVLMVILPPSGMASRALTQRLMSTCSNCDRSVFTGHRSRP
ncbi:hypothetical protein D3C72_1947150 [compost metagenome]